MTESPTTTTTDDVSDRAADAMLIVFRQHLRDLAPPRHVVAEALEAAGAVYDAAEADYVQQLMDSTMFAGMNVTDKGIQIRLKMATEIASGMVNAFDALIQASRAENYVEQSWTATDPALEQAIADRLPIEQWPPRRQYTFLVIKPDGKSPHELRKEADARADALAAQLEWARAAGADPRVLRWCEWPGCLRSFDAIRGPVDDPGWKRFSRAHILLCPEHSPAGHVPDYQMDPRDLTYLTAVCECGETAAVRPSNLDAVTTWWTTHVVSLT